MYSRMPSHFRIVLFLLLIAKGMSTGLQFISLPTSAYDLIYIQTAWRNPSQLNSAGKSPELSYAYGKWWFGTGSGLDVSYDISDDLWSRIKLSGLNHSDTLASQS